MKHTCNRGGEVFQLKETFCPICGLSAYGSQGRIDKIKINKINSNYHFINTQNSSEELVIPYRIKRHKIWKYYDIDTLTQKTIDLDLARLHAQIEMIEGTLIFLESSDSNNPDMIEFYKERDKIRDKLDTIYDFLSVVTQKRLSDALKDDELELLYGRLPEWRVKQMKEKRAFKYYHFNLNK